MTRSLGVGMIGYAFMGAAHSQAWRTVNRFYDLPVRGELTVLCGRDRGRVEAAAQRYGFAEATTDWRAVVGRADVAVVDVCSPGDTHAEVAIAALEAGQHVLCEKPLANTVAEARAMAAAAERSAARSMVGFSYRRVPAVTLARDLVRAGRIGAIRQIQAAYLQDWLTDPQAPLTWRLQADRAGSGALGDIGAHAVDLAQFITGHRVSGVAALLDTYVRERPRPDGGGLGPVTVDDAATFIARTDRGATATFAASRVAAGRKNGLRVEVHGERGSLAFDLERMNELEFHDATLDPAEAGFRRILVTEPGHPYVGIWPPGHTIGYEHAFTHEIRDFLAAIAADRAPEPSFADGLQVQLVLAAVASSAAHGSAWTAVDTEERDE